MAKQIRPPIITILGHVDHGKTTLLDFIRKTAVAAKEQGGITQAIGAYQVQENEHTLTFIDTPGHAAFEKMRSRGALAADIAVLVVAVDDGVMPQTIEAIKHIKSANIPMLVAINKIDLPGINIKIQTEKIKKQLADQGVLVEEYGGDTPVALLSAKSGEGIPAFLETINLLAEIHEFKADPEKKTEGVIIESRLDKFKGPLATVLVKDGTLKKGDQIKAGEVLGKVKGMINWQGQMLERAGPSTPVEVLGFNLVPAVGSKLGEEVSEKGEVKEKTKSLIEKLRENKTKTLNVVIKADTEGSLEAIKEALNKLNKEEHNLNIISDATGEVSDSDIETARSCQGLILAFNIGVRSSAQKLAETNHVLIRSYKIIYEMIDEMADVVENMLKLGALEEVFGRAQVIAEFAHGKLEKIAGCQVIEGTIVKGPKIRIIREGAVIGKTKIKSLKKGKVEASKVSKGEECGLLLEEGVDFKIGDMIESFRTF